MNAGEDDDMEEIGMDGCRTVIKDGEMERKKQESINILVGFLSHYVHSDSVIVLCIHF